MISAFNKQFKADEIKDKIVGNHVVIFPSVAIKFGDSFSLKDMMKKWPESQINNQLANKKNSN